MRVLLVPLVLLALAPPSPAPRPTAVYGGDFQLRVPAGQTVAIVFPVPGRLASGDRAVTFTWRIVKPIPAPKFVFLVHCLDQDRCYPSIMRPTGEASGTLGSPYRIDNKSRLEVDVQIRYALWEVR